MWVINFNIKLSYTHTHTGQFFSPKVRIDTSTKELTRASGITVPIEEGPIWESVNDGVYVDTSCWYPKQGYSAIDGEPWEYVVEHIQAFSFKHTLYKQY